MPYFIHCLVGNQDLKIQTKSKLKSKLPPETPHIGLHLIFHR
jgi:hypothetical protein